MDIFRKFFKLILAFFMFFALIFIAVGMYILTFYNSNAAKDANCVLVFGAAVEPDGYASPLLYDRVSSAVKLYQDKKASCIFLSGAPSPYGVHEVDVMRNIAEVLGVNPADIKEDKRGLNTCYSIKNANKSLSYILLSNNFHLARIDYFAKQFGLNYTLQSANESQGPYLKSSFFFFREVLANIYYRLFFDETCETGLKWLSDGVYRWVNKIQN